MYLQCIVIVDSGHVFEVMATLSQADNCVKRKSYVAAILTHPLTHLQCLQAANILTFLAW